MASLIHHGEAFHGDVVGALVFADVVDGDDVGVVKAGDGPAFAKEALNGFFFPEEVRAYDLEGVHAVQGGVACLVDHGVSATADFFKDFVFAKSPALLVGHWIVHSCSRKTAVYRTT